MANGGNRTIAPVRKLIGAVLGTVATFVTVFGLGMTSWAIVALGVALLVLAIALATVRGGGRTWVIGLGHVHSASEPPTQYAFGRCELQLVIDAPGLPPRSKKIIEPRVPVAKWPSLGQALPVRVALDDQRHVRVLWDEVPTHAESAAAVADLPPEYAAEPDPLDEPLIAQEAPPLAYLAGLVVLAFVHPFLPAWRWTAIHLLLLGAVSNAVVVWSAHFAAAVLRAPAPDRRRAEAARLAALNVGVLAVLTGG
ncbi:hypothetical protein ACISRB_30750, partial [Micromonospora aurantiaca]